ASCRSSSPPSRNNICRSSPQLTQPPAIQPNFPSLAWFTSLLQAPHALIQAECAIRELIVAVGITQSKGMDWSPMNYTDRMIEAPRSEGRAGAESGALSYVL